MQLPCASRSTTPKGMAPNQSPRTSKLCGPSKERLTLDEIERISL